jgi:hypothetical protein
MGKPTVRGWPKLPEPGIKTTVPLEPALHGVATQCAANSGKSLARWIRDLVAGSVNRDMRKPSSS